MDLRSASLQIIEKELKPFLELAIQRHPQPIDIKVKRGNIVTAKDYARRILIKARKEGFGEHSAEKIRCLRPRLRVYLSKGGITLAGMKQKYSIPKRWDNYKIPFDAMPNEDSRWVTIAVSPTQSQIVQLADLLVRGVLENPVELRTKLTPKEVRALIGPLDIQVFKTGRNVMIWPKKESEE